FLAHLAELMLLDRSRRPVQTEQPLEVIIAADVVPADAVPFRLPGPMRVATEGEGDALRVTLQQLLQGTVAAEGVPEQDVQGCWGLGARKAEVVNRGMMGGNDDPANLLQRAQQMPLEGGDHARSEAGVVQGPADVIGVIVPAAAKMLALQPMQLVRIILPQCL